MSAGVHPAFDGLCEVPARGALVRVLAPQLHSCPWRHSGFERDLHQAVAARIRAVVGTSAAVTDIATVRNSVGSSLTSVDLAGLTRIELSFALVLAVGAGALVLALGLAERCRSYALLTVLGARSWHLRAMVFSETGVLTVAGILAGALTGSVLSVMLVKVLTGVFDPPPATVAIPWLYLVTVLTVTVGALAAVSAASVVVVLRRSALTVIRDL